MTFNRRGFLKNASLAGLALAAGERGMKYLFGMGLFSWGYDQILKADPAVQGRSKAGQPLPHVMCGAKEKAWGYVQKNRGQWTE